MNYMPPNSVEAERNVLGAIIIDKEELLKVIMILKEEDFYNPDHQLIYKTILELTANNQTIDIISVSEKLDNFEYISNLATGITVTCNAVNHAKLVKGKSIRRQFAKAGMEIINKSAYGEFDNIVDFKNSVMADIDIEIDNKNQSSTDIKIMADNYMDTLEKKYNKPDNNNKKYGIDKLDGETNGVHDSELTIIAARPSVGKTALALQLALNLSAKKNKTAIFSLEMGNEQLIDRLISNVAGVEFSKVRSGRLSDAEWVKVTRGSQILKAMDINIYDDIYNVEQIRASCRQLKNKGGLDVIIIDYLQLCDTMKKTGNTNDKISHITRQFKLLSKEMKCPVMLLSQLSRKGEDDNSKPKLSHLRDSGAIEADADNVFFLHDESYGNYDNENTSLVSPIMFIIGKQRQGTRDTKFDIGFMKSQQKFINLKGDN